MTHHDHCGGCEQPCAGDEVCINGACSADCPGDWEVCGDVCVDTNTDPAHCGGCDKPCADGEECASGVCQCPQGTEPCANTCVDTATDLAHCGKCDNLCPDGANAITTCAMGMCGQQCNMGYEDCNMKPDGCETNLTTDLQHCGKCGNSCPSVSNGVPVCKGANCGIGSCNNGYDDCDNQLANGCEADLNNDDKNCGQCKYDCGVGNYCTGGQCKTAPTVPFAQSSYAASMTFTDQLSSTTMTMAWDGTYLWACSGGGPSGDRLARYTASGALLQKYAPGYDFRSVFTKGDGSSPIYSRLYSSMKLLVQTSPGVFSGSVTLAGSVDSQSAVVWDAQNSIFVAHKGGTLYRWTASGSQLSSVGFSGYGTQHNESSSPQDRGVVTTKGYYFTYSDGVLSAWNSQGTRIDTTKLSSAGTSGDSYYSLSYAQGKVWVVDSPGGTWRGYDVGL